MVRIDSFFVAAIAAATLLVWAGLNRPVGELPWPERIDGFAFSPLRAGADPALTPYPSAAEIAADLELIAERAGAVRSYSLEGSLAALPALAEPLGLAVTVGVWLDTDEARAAAEIKALREAAARHDNIERAIVGNEAVLRGDLTVAELATVLDGLRAELDVPIGTAEPWHIWLEHPELASHVDFIAVHVLPYWEGVHVDDAVDFTAARIAELEARFPDLPIVVGEVGWPSRGRSRAAAEPSAQNADIFLRRFVAHAEGAGYDYFLMEAFDQPWKRASEGEVGAHWGVYDAWRAPKYAFDAAEIVPIDGWPRLALVSLLGAALAYLALMADGRGLHWRGRMLIAAGLTGLASAAVLCIAEFAGQYWTFTGLAFGALLVAGLVGVIGLALVEAHEWVELRWARRRRRFDTPQHRAAHFAPKVSIHVPIHREPPAMVLETLRALAALDYPRFEVVVVDNNTDDERLWRPVEAFCAQQGAPFRFFHVAPLAGYKAGALNFALQHTAEDADVVAVIDSDYKVEPQWLADLTGHFAAARVAIVQAPQAYRDGAASPFKAMCETEYDGFFKVGMVARNDRNAIIQHGTMTMIRKDVLVEVGGWAEWTVTEDAELGLRVLEHGYDTVYVPRCYGRGLTPDNFHDYKVQRYRWALGALQILHRHGRRLLGIEPSRLTLGQRFHFLTGWLGWLADGANLLFTGAALVWSTLMIAAPLEFEPPLSGFSVFVLALFAFKLVKTMSLYRREVGASVPATLGGIVAGLALVYVVGRAVLSGLRAREARFLRTPKLAERHSLAGAIAASRTEGLLAILLLAAALGVGLRASFASFDLDVWIALLVTLAVPHLAALGLSLASALPRAQTAHAAPRLAETAEAARRS